MKSGGLKQKRGLELISFIVSAVLLVAWCLIIAWFSSGTGEQSQSLSDGAIAKVISFLQPGFSQMTENQQAQIIGAWSFPVRKMAHFTEYFILCGLAVKALLQAKNVFGRHNGLKATQICALAVMFSFLYACGDEFHQSFVNGRAGRLFDVGVDTLGAAVTCAVYMTIRALTTKR